MSALYTRQANRARLAAGAAEKLKSIPSTIANVRDVAQNAVANQPLAKRLVGEAEVQSTNNDNDL